MERSGQFYMIDAFIAAVILFLGIGVILAVNVSVPEQQQLQQSNKDIMRILVDSKMEDQSNDYLRLHADEIQFDRSPAQQILEWQHEAIDPAVCGAPALPPPDEYASCALHEEANKMSEAFLDKLIPQQQQVRVRLEHPSGENWTIFAREDPAETAEIQIVQKQIIYVLDSSNNLVGPATVEVTTWN